MLQSKAALNQGWIGKGKVSCAYRSSYKGAEAEFQEMKLRDSKGMPFKSIESMTLSGMRNVSRDFHEVRLKEQIAE